MNIEDLISNYPKLFHMAEKDSWENIKNFGLHSTTSLAELYELSTLEKETVIDLHRPESVRIAKNGLPDAVIRDQKPMSDAGLERALPPEISPSDWYRFLNNKVFFWTSENRLHRLLNAGTYRDQEHDVLILDANSLIRKVQESISLCPINSGCTKPMPRPRDFDTFSSIAEYDWEYWKSKRPKWDAVVEVCVEQHVADIEDHIIEVRRMRGSETLRAIR